MKKSITFKSLLSFILLFVGINAWGTEYELVTSTSQLEAGKTYLIGSAETGSAYFISTTSNTNNRPLSALATITNNKVTLADDMLQLTLGGSEGAWTFKTENYEGTAGYLNATSTTSSNNLKVVATLDKYAYFTVSFSSDAAVITCTGKSSRNIVRYNSTNSMISCYTSGQAAVYLFKEVEDASDTRTATTTSFPASAYSAYIGESFTSPTATVNNGGTVTYSSSATGVATVNASTGEVSLVAPGTTTIKATYAGDDIYASSSASYSLTVLAAAALPFSFDGGKSDFKEGMTQTGLGSDYKSPPFLKFDDENDEVVICFKKAGSPVLQFSIKGNSFSGGTFDVMESDNGTLYTSVNSYTNLSSTATTETAILTPTSHYIKFVYSAKSSGNVALGNISIFEGYAVNVTNAKYATFYSSLSGYVLPSDCKGYVFANGKLNEAYSSSNIIPAGEPIVIYSENAGIKAIKYDGGYSSETYKSQGKNDLDGTDMETDLSTQDDASSNIYYALSLNSEGETSSVGFYFMKEGGAAFTNGAHKAYLKLAKSGGAKTGYPFNDNEASAINAVETSVDMNAPVYNLAGQRVAPTTKGILIQNGKKYIVK